LREDSAIGIVLAGMLALGVALVSRGPRYALDLSHFLFGNVLGISGQELIFTGVFTVLTLGLIGCWQVFDQIYTGTQGAPGNTTLTPAYLSYQAGFQDQKWGNGAAIAFILFLIIIAFTVLQRWVLRDKAVSRRRVRAYAPKGTRT
ncbi:MAG TPA: metal ABC transporter permease, partial [Microbacteriaceae bacterium]|nr:metal ABC transporter permease [Microbacteriaceae bacterium]